MCVVPSDGLWLHRAPRACAPHRSFVICVLSSHCSCISLPGSLDSNPLLESFIPVPLVWGAPLCPMLAHQGLSQCRFFRALTTWVSLSLARPCQSYLIRRPGHRQCRSCPRSCWRRDRCEWRGSRRAMLASRWWAWGEEGVTRRGGSGVGDRREQTGNG